MCGDEIGQKGKKKVMSKHGVLVGETRDVDVERCNGGV